MCAPDFRLRIESSRLIPSARSEGVHRRPSEPHQGRQGKRGCDVLSSWRKSEMLLWAEESLLGQRYRRPCLPRTSQPRGSNQKSSSFLSRSSVKHPRAFTMRTMTSKKRVAARIATDGCASKLISHTLYVGFVWIE